MGVRTTITNKGLQLLGSSSAVTGQYYWIGYYALAYVPDFWKDEDTITLPVDNCGNVNNGILITENDNDPIISSMTKLTNYGDIIWNIWQGDLVGTGFVGGESDGSSGGNLFGLSMYSKSIRANYRYVIDENGNNTLVAWRENDEGDYIGKSIYKGTDGFSRSELPLPAPLYYLGDMTGKVSVDSFVDFYTDSDYNGSTIMPSLTVTLKNSTMIEVPKISSDYRKYVGSLGESGSVYDPTLSAEYFDQQEIPNALHPSFGVNGWFSADATFEVPIYLSSEDEANVCTEFWKLHTISNYNRANAPVGNLGVMSSDLSTRNISKVTKLFPIANYKVINSKNELRSTDEKVEVATAIQLTIKVDITPQVLGEGDDSVLTLFDNYDTVYTDPMLKDQFGNNIYNATHISFKFNRIGIYAVPLRKHPYVTGSNSFGGTDVSLQFQIDPEAEPVLFAVMDWDNVMSLDDTGNGATSFMAQVDLNLEASVSNSSIVKESTIFHNLYEDDAITWYQNQLIANAQTQNAITELALQVGSIKQQLEKACCAIPDFTKLFDSFKSQINSNISANTLRNIQDSNNKLNGGIKSIESVTEGTAIGGELYQLGKSSIALGQSVVAFGDYSVAIGGENNQIFKNSTRSSLIGGIGNQLRNYSNDSVILNSRYVYISGSSISDSNNGIILSGNETEPSEENKTSIITSKFSSILSSSGSKITTGIYSSLLSTQNSNITNSTRALIMNSNDSSVISGSNNFIIGSNLVNIITSTYSNITYSSIISSYNSIINTMSNYSSIYGSKQVKIYNDNNTYTNNVIIGSYGDISGDLYYTYIYNCNRSGILFSSNSSIRYGNNFSIISSSNIGINPGEYSTENNICVISSNSLSFDIYDTQSNIAIIARTTALPGTLESYTLYTDKINCTQLTSSTNYVVNVNMTGKLSTNIKTTIEQNEYIDFIGLYTYDNNKTYNFDREQSKYLIQSLLSVDGNVIINGNTISNAGISLSSGTTLDITNCVVSLGGAILNASAPIIFDASTISHVYVRDDDNKLYQLNRVEFKAFIDSLS